MQGTLAVRGDADADADELLDTNPLAVLLGDAARPAGAVAKRRTDVERIAVPIDAR